MSFTMLLLFAAIIMSAGAFMAFRRQHKIMGTILVLIMVLGILILGYLWIHSPM